MSNGATVDRPVPHRIAFSKERRTQMMRVVIKRLSDENCLRIEFSPAIAQTYGVSKESVEAEMMKHLSEGDGGK